MVIFVLVFAGHCLLACSFFFVPLLPRQLNLDPVHPPDVSDLALCYIEQLQSLLIKDQMVPLNSLQGKSLARVLPHPITVS